MYLLALSTLLTVIAATETPIIQTTLGALRGSISPFQTGVATVYKGIPFAAPPIGPLRWQAPQPATAWSGVRNATSFGTQCAQSYSEASLFDSGKTAVSEDCLYLNIWTPTYEDTSDILSKRLPVYFWIYGGRFVSGSGDVITYDGTGLAAKDVIVVTFNYRMGPFGYLAHPELSAESPHNSSGNYGMLDQKAALEWVYANIAQFGGDPSRITVGGQSAGSASSLDLMYSPLTRDFVAGAIAESGARGPHDPLTGSLAVSYRLKDAAEKQGVEFQKKLNASSTAEMRNVSMETLISYQDLDDTTFEGTIFENLTAKIFEEPPLWRPVVDGYFLNQTYLDSLLTGNHADVPILTGNNLDETGVSTDPGLNVTSYTVYGQMFQNCSEEFFAMYPGNTASQADNSSNAFFGDLARVSTWTWVQDWLKGGAKSDVYVYYWTHTPPVDASDGAYHGSEMFYVFNGLPYSSHWSNATWTSLDYAIEDRMSSYWANFIKTGNPNGEGLPYFPPTTQARQVMWLGDEWVPGYLAKPKNMKFIQQWLSSLPAW